MTSRRSFLAATLAAAVAPAFVRAASLMPLWVPKAKPKDEVKAFRITLNNGAQYFFKARMSDVARDGEIFLPEIYLPETIGRPRWLNGLHVPLQIRR